MKQSPATGVSADPVELLAIASASAAAEAAVWAALCQLYSGSGAGWPVQTEAQSVPSERSQSPTLRARASSGVIA